MFLGHYAVAIGAKKVAPKTSLGTLLAAAAFLDLVWPVLVLLGFERVVVAPGATAFTPLDFEHYPISHSLLMSVVWGIAFGAAYFFVRRDRRGATVLAALVVSHWLLDAVVHRPDLPLTLGGDARIGLGLWNSIPGTLAVELAMFAAAVWLYVGATRARDRIGSLGLVAFLLFVLAIYAGAAFGPPPPSATAIAWSDMGQWLVVLFAAWIDRHRSMRSA
ncbi:MAG TPA: hypothetical protein VL131_02245 [Gammaproteobacteria bacterium]|nr:hypothetical protein [Gammaproteobacteria bacterium]